MMKKVMALLMVFAFALSMVACSSSYKDGTYTAEAAEFDENSGWKDNVTVTISGGKITAVNWNSTYKDDTKQDKKTEAKNGTYGMAAIAKAGEWDEQAKVMEDIVVKDQGTGKIKTTSEGYADGITGCTIHVNGFVSLVKDALAKAK